MSSYTFPGPPDRFPDTDTFPGFIDLVSILMEIFIFYPKLVEWSGGKISNISII